MESSILFVTAFEILFIGAQQMIGGIKLQKGQRLSPPRNYMDDVSYPADCSMHKRYSKEAR